MNQTNLAVYTAKLSSEGYSVYRNGTFLNGVGTKECDGEKKPIRFLKVGLDSYGKSLEREMDFLKKAENYLGFKAVETIIESYGNQRAYVKLLNIGISLPI